MILKHNFALSCIFIAVATLGFEYTTQPLSNVAHKSITKNSCRRHEFTINLFISYWNSSDLVHKSRHFFFVHSISYRIVHRLTKYVSRIECHRRMLCCFENYLCLFVTSELYIGEIFIDWLPNQMVYRDVCNPHIVRVSLDTWCDKCMIEKISKLASMS